MRCQQDVIRIQVSLSDRVFPRRQRVQHLVEQLQRAVQVDLQPAGGVFDAGPWVVAPPTFNKAQSHDAQPAQVIHTQTCSQAHTCGRKQTHLYTWGRS